MHDEQTVNGLTKSPWAQFPFETATYIYVLVSMLLFQTENGKQNPRRFSLIHFLFAHCNGSLSIVHLLTKKQREVICFQMD